MYYIFGRTDNRLSVDKDNRLALDLAPFLASAKYDFDSNEFYFTESLKKFFLPLNTPATVDDIQVTNNQVSCYFTKRSMLQFLENGAVYNGTLVDNDTLYDLTDYFTPTFDSNDNIKSYLTNNAFGTAVIQDGDNKLNGIQFIVGNPIVNIKIGDDTFDNHTFILSKQYLLDYATQFKLYCIPLNTIQP